MYVRCTIIHQDQVHQQVMDRQLSIVFKTQLHYYILKSIAFCLYVVVLIM